MSEAQLNGCAKAKTLKLARLAPQSMETPDAAGLELPRSNSSRGTAEIHRAKDPLRPSY